MLAGDKIIVKDTHGIPEWRGDTGTIEKLVQFNKAYVQLRRNGRQLVDVRDIEELRSGYMHCSCYSCFDIIVGCAGDMCDDCSEAGCTEDHECQVEYSDVLGYDWVSGEKVE